MFYGKLMSQIADFTWYRIHYLKNYILLIPLSEKKEEDKVKEILFKK